MVGQGLTLDLALLSVSSRQRDQIEVAAVHEIQIQGHDPLEADRLAAAVADPGRTHDDVRLLKHGIEKGHAHLCDRVLDDQLQRIHRVRVCRKSSRKTVQRESTPVDPVGNVSSVKGKAPVPILYFDGIDAEIALLLCRKLLRLRIQ